MKKGILFLFSTGFTSFIVLLLFGLLITFNAISSNIDEVIWIHLLMSLSLEILKSNWLTYSGGTDNLVNSWTYFLLGSLTMTLTVLLYWIYLFLLVLVFVWQHFFLHRKILIMLSQFPSTFCHTQNRMLHCIVYDCPCADWDGFHDILEMLLGRKSINSVFLLLLENFVSWLKLEFMNIPHCNYQVKPHFSL